MDSGSDSQTESSSPSSAPSPAPSEARSDSPSPSDDSEAPSPPPNPGPYEWLRLTDIIFAVFLNEVPRAVSWSSASLMIFSFPHLDAAPPSANWYLTLESTASESAGRHWHTLDLFGQSWVVETEESSLTFTFSLGNVEAGNGQRYFIKTGCHESFSYLLSHVAYIRGCAVGAPLEIPDEL